MAATVTAKLALDASGFTATLTKAKAALGKLSAVGVPAIAAGLAAAAAAATGLAVGVKSAIDLGGALSELSSRTGVAAGTLRVLQEAFQRSGLSADSVGQYVNKLQRAIVEAGTGTGPAAKAFQSLGLSVESLRGLSAAEQFQTIGQAIGALPDPAARAAAAMQIFGRSGGELLALFSNSGAMAEAARAVGAQADILTQNADMFDKASDILNGIGTKLQGFFVGVADTLVPALMPLLEAADGIDLSGMGQDLGNAIAFGLTIITSGNLGNILSAQLKLSGAQFINLLVQGITGMAAFLTQRLVDIPAEFVTILGIVTKAEFWAGVGNGLLAAAMKFAAVIQRAAASLLDAVSNVPGLGGAAGLAAGYRESAAQMDAEAAERAAAASDALSGPLAQVRERIAQSFNNAVNAAAAAMEQAGETIDTTELQAARDGLVGEITAQMESNRAAAKAKFNATKTQMPDLEGIDTASTGRSNTGILAQSLQQVGGGAAFARFSDAANPAAQQLREQQKANGYLSKIADGIGAFVSQPALMPV